MIYIVTYEASNMTRQEEMQKQKTLSKWLFNQAVYKETGKISEDFSIYKGENGKPYIHGEHFYFNISHCKGLVCCAVHTEEIGVDVERVGTIKENVIKRVCTAEEAKDIEYSENQTELFFQYWTLKESYVKYIGEGLRFGLKNAQFGFRGEKPFCVNDDIYLFQKKLCIGKEKYIISACVKEKANFEICELTAD